jgi:hypothetical protein
MWRWQSYCGCCRNRDIVEWTISCFEGKGFSSNFEKNSAISSSWTISKTWYQVASSYHNPSMASITTLKLQSFHVINSKILSKGKKITLSSLANLQGQRNTKFGIPWTHWRTLKKILKHLFIGAILFLRLSFFKAMHCFIFVWCHSLSLSHLSFEMFHIWKFMFFKHQVQMTSIISSSITTLHHCVKFNNIQTFFLELLVGNFYQPLPNVSTLNCFQCLLYLTSIHDLTLFLIISYLAVFIYYFQSEAFFTLSALYFTFIWLMMSGNILCYIAWHPSFKWGLMLYPRL